jgi:ABC-type transporter Mla MlaB component
MSDATGEIAMSLKGEVERRRKLVDFERTMNIQMQTSEPVIMAKLAKEGIGHATSAAASALLPWFESAKKTANGIMGYY